MIQVMPEAVDTELFDPRRHASLERMAKDTRFKFLSVFKWEARKVPTYKSPAHTHIHTHTGFKFCVPCRVTDALLLLCYCLTTALLLLYYCFATVLLLLYY